MARADAEYKCQTCGKRFVFYKTVANRKTAEDFEVWAAENITECNTCRTTRLAAAHMAENNEAMKDAEVRGLPAICGTKKQISWATKIRSDFLKSMEEVTFAETNLKDRGMELLREETVTFLASHTWASWWIDQRNDFRILKQSITQKVIDRLRAENPAFDKRCREMEAKREQAEAEQAARNRKREIRDAAFKVVNYFSGPKDNKEHVRRFLRCQDEIFLEAVMKEVKNFLGK